MSTQCSVEYTTRTNRQTLDEETRRIGEEQGLDEGQIKLAQDKNWYKSEIKALQDSGNDIAANILMYIYDNGTHGDGKLAFSYNRSKKYGHMKVLSVVVDEKGIKLIGDNKVYTFDNNGVAKFKNGIIFSNWMKNIKRESELHARDVGGLNMFYSDAGSNDIRKDRAAFKQAEADLLKNPDKMNSLLDELIKIDGDKVSNEYGQFLRKLMGDMIKSNMIQNIPDMVVRMNTTANKSGGLFVAKGEDKGIWLNISEHNARAGNEMSASEAYVHELIHAMTEYAKVNRNTEISGYMAQIMKIREKALKELTVEDLMPNDEDSVDKILERKIAEDRLEYFSSENGLSEFTAYAMTNEKMIAKLKTIDRYSKNERKNQRQTSEAKSKRSKQSSAANLFDWLGEIIKTIGETILAWSKVESINATADRAMFDLVRKISRMNNEALIKQRGQGLWSSTVDGIRERMDAVNGFWHVWTSKLLEKDDEKALAIAKKMNEEIAELRENGNFISKSWFLARNIGRLFQNQIMFNAFMSALNAAGIKRNGMIQMVIKGFRDKDDLQRTLERLGLLSNKIDQNVENIAITHGQMVLDGFKDKPSDAEQIAMTEGVLGIDLQSIASDYSDKEIIELLANNGKKLNEEINRITKELSKNENGNYYISQSAWLGKYMATGKGRESTMPSAEMIVSSINNNANDETSMRIHRIDDKKLVNKVDKLATLYGLLHSDESTKNQVANMISKDAQGVRNLMDMHKAFIQDSDERLFSGDNWVLKKKGFTKSIDGSHDRVRLSGNSESDAWFKSQGYKQVGKRGPDGIRVWHADFDPQATFNTAAMKFTDIHSKSNNLLNTSYTGIEDIDIKKARLLKKEHDEKRYQQTSDMLKQIVLPEIEEEYDTDGDNLSSIPILGADGNPRTYQYQMAKRMKSELKGQDRKVAHVMGRMFASVDDKVQSKEINDKVVDLLISEAIKNREGNEIGVKYGIGKDMNDYIKLTDNNKDMGISDIYRMLPVDVKNKIKAYEKKYNEPLMVRADLLNNYFGFRSISFANNKLVKMMGPQMQQAVRKAGKYWTDAVKITKVNYVMRAPNTVIQNVISNFSLSMLMGMSPKKVWMLQAQGKDALTQYINDEKKLIKLKATYKMKPTNALKNEIKRLEENIRTSDVSPLMDAGLYQSIVSDVNVAELRNDNVVADAANKVSSKLPQFMQDVGKQIYMAEGTSMLQMVVTATQYSDFIARYAMYHHLITKKDAQGNREHSKKEALEIVLDAFINYTNPDSAGLQWLNDVGLMMFTKFFFRIQKVLKNLTLKRPTDVLALLATQWVLGDLSDVFEYNIISKNYGTLFHSPFDIVSDLIKPWGLDFVPEAVNADLFKDPWKS